MLIYFLIGLLVNVSFFAYWTISTKKFSKIDLVMVFLMLPLWPLMAYGFVRLAIDNICKHKDVS